MTKKILAMVLSTSLALTSITVTPARADDDVGKVLAGIAALLVIGAAVNKNKHKKERQQVTQHSNRQVWTTPTRRHVRKKAAPQRCLRNQWTHRGNRQVYGARCMNRHADALLPRNCLRHADVNQGPRKFYTKRCLRKNGWRA